MEMKLSFILEKGKVTVYENGQPILNPNLEEIILKKYGKYNEVTGDIMITKEKEKTLIGFKNVIIKDLLQ